MKASASFLVRLGLVPLAMLAPAAATAPDTTTVKISIPASPQLPNPHALLPPSTRASLTALHASHAAPISVTSGFVFGNVSAGSYLLDVHCLTHAFAPLRVDVLSSPAAAAAGTAGAGGQLGAKRLVVAAWETFRGNDWDNKGEAATKTPGGAFAVKVLGPKGYYMERSGFSVFSILKNPMILLALVSMGIFVGMPYLMDNMDPEIKAEFEARQRGSPMNAMLGAAGGQQGGAGNFDMAAFLAGSSTKKDDGGIAASGPAPPASGGRKGQGGGRR